MNTALQPPGAINAYLYFTISGQPDLAIDKGITTGLEPGKPQ